MPHLVCPCGESISLSPIPNPQGFHLVAERAVEPLVEAVASAHAQIADPQRFERQLWAIPRSLPLGTMHVYECVRCRRLAIFRRASDSLPLAWYTRERPSNADAEQDAALSDVVTAALSSTSEK